MTIRESNRDDLNELLELYTHLHDNPVPDKDENLLVLWEQILADPCYFVIVAEENGKILSSCILVIVPNLTHEQRPFGLIENVVTHSAYRNRGFASACLDYAREIAQKHNCYKMMLLTGSKKESTLNFYRKAGYNSEDKTAFIRWL